MCVKSFSSPLLKVSSSDEEGLEECLEAPRAAAAEDAIPALEDAGLEDEGAGLQDCTEAALREHTHISHEVTPSPQQSTNS